MLVLTRKTGEVVTIGSAVEIRILKIRGSEVSLGIVAPRDLPVHRKEVYEEISRENMSARRITAPDVESGAITRAAAKAGAAGLPRQSLDLAKIASALPGRGK